MDRFYPHLDPAMPAGAAIRIILGQLLEAMEDTLEGARDGVDPEFLHDLRVAVRRTRSLFNQIPGVLPDAVVERFGQEFRWLGEITGPARDWDVYLFSFPSYRASLDEPMRSDLEPLHGFLAERQAEAQQDLAGQLASDRCRHLFRTWREFLESPAEQQPWPTGAGLPILGIASRCIWKACRRTWREGRSIDAESPPTAFHALRIRCKKLRYLMEFFQSLYPPEEMRGLIRSLKGLQDNLGGHQDLSTQIQALHSFAAEMQRTRNDIPGATFIAMGVLIGHLNHCRLCVRQDFTPLFARFADKETRRLCKALFREQEPPRPGPASGGPLCR